ncbi:VOC family protein [Sphingomonas sp. PR090111-T3T-6A]|uniref:VOC family protein n=1 Tax=Sphingomonas sp. PR090111-T3T-6A TaxID=685778 RepID=UPI00037A8CED|nr:VOC family protein [Sphingomonas sp. PR090111-T3T-6A]
MQLRFNNVALAVSDLERAIAWYGEVLGFTVAERGRFDAVGAGYAMVDGAGIRIELVHRERGAFTPVDRTAPPHHLDVLGWKALVLEADDLPAATASFADKGAEIMWADMQISADRRGTMLRDPDGNLIHIFGPRGVI